MATRIAIVGATGETGGSIVDGLLGSESQFVRTSAFPTCLTLLTCDRKLQLWCDQAQLKSQRLSP